MTIDICTYDVEHGRWIPIPGEPPVDSTIPGEIMRRLDAASVKHELSWDDVAAIHSEDKAGLPLDFPPSYFCHACGNTIREMWDHFAGKSGGGKDGGAPCPLWRPKGWEPGDPIDRERLQAAEMLKANAR